jgi:small subunit ribosomal protein S7
MPRKGEVKKREGLPDPKYGDKQVAKFINTLMTGGKKSVAEGIFYRSLDLVGTKIKEDSLAVFKRALENAKPTVEVRSRRVGGATYQLAGAIRLRARRQVNGRKTRGRINRCGQQSRRRSQEKGRYASDGGSQPGLCPLSLVASQGGFQVGGGSTAFFFSGKQQWQERFH